MILHTLRTYGSCTSAQLAGGEFLVENQRVLVICNVLPREIHGHRSEAGLLVARNGKGKAAARPPEAAPLGEAVDGERRPGEDFEIFLDIF